MKRIILLIALSGVAFQNINAQRDSISKHPSLEADTVIKNTLDSVPKIKKEHYAQLQAEKDSNSVLTDFLLYWINKSKPKSAGNLKWHVRGYLGIGFIAGTLENNPADLLYGKSYSCDFGIKWRYQISHFYSLTFNTGFLYNRYRIANGMNNNILGTPFVLEESNDFIVHSERFRTWGFGVSIGNRFNFGKQRTSSSNGKYVEISAYGNYTYTREYVIELKGIDEIDSKLSYKDPVLFNPFEAGVQVNIGFNWFSIWGRYRVTDWFNNSYTHSKLPPFVIGFSFN